MQPLQLDVLLVTIKSHHVMWGTMKALYLTVSGEPLKVEKFNTPMDCRSHGKTRALATRVNKDLTIELYPPLILSTTKPQAAEPMLPHPGSGLRTPEGLRLAHWHQLLRSQLPHDIHDFVLEGLCKAIDGVHILSALPTDAGTTGNFYCFILPLRALRKLSPPCSLLTLQNRLWF